MTQISDTQREQLSAYLDGALPDHERIAVEQSLRADPALAEELRELQIMAALLRDLPAVRPPRTFTLDPAVHGRRRGFFMPVWLRWATTLGALVLVLTVSLSLNRGAGSPTRFSAQLNQGSAGGAAPESAMQPLATTTSAAESPAGMGTTLGDTNAAAGAPEAGAMAGAPPADAADGVAAAPESPEMPTVSASSQGPAADVPEETAQADVIGEGVQIPRTDETARYYSAPLEPFSETAKLSATEQMDLLTIQPTLTFSADALGQSATASPPAGMAPPAEPAPAPSLAQDSGPSLLLIFGVVLLVGVFGAAAVTFFARRFERRR